VQRVAGNVHADYFMPHSSNSNALGTDLTASDCAVLSVAERALHFYCPQ